MNPSPGVDTRLPIGRVCGVIVYSYKKSAPAGIVLAAILAVLPTCGCSLVYEQGADFQRLEVEVMRPINVHRQPESR